MEQMFDVVASVENYKTFLPWCTQSTVYDRKPGQFRCDLSVGYPPLAEKYSCLVTVSRPHLVKVCLKLALLIINTKKLALKCNVTPYMMYIY
jgi:ribosome-associated toxin RatA of RatAB toxin-antitoxin module